MDAPFDPYYQWLGIPAADQPPSHYRLLGISMIEDDPDVISAASEQRMKYVQSFHAGEHAADAQRIFDELLAARDCLLDATARARYTETLRGDHGQLAMRSSAAEQRGAVGAPPLAAPPVSRSPPAAPAAARTAGSGAPVAAPARRRRTIPLAHMMAGATVILALVVAIVFLQRYLAGRDNPAPAPGPAPTQLPEADGGEHLAGKSVVIPEGVAYQDDEGTLPLTADQARSNGEAVGVEDAAIVDWNQDQPVQWDLLIDKPGIFMVEVTYAADAAAAGGTASITINDRTLSFYVRNTGGDYVMDETKMVAIRRGGRYTLVMTPEKMPSGQLARVQSIRLRPAAIKTRN